MIIALIAVGFVVLCFILLYNNLVGKKNQVATAFSSIDVLLKKRFDLIPNLTQMVKRYMKHEADVLTRVTEMRSKSLSGNMTDAETVAMDRQVSSALGQIMVAVENYPDLKASENFINLQASLNEVEEQISAARRAYNASVKDYNNALEMFPSNIVAGFMRYERKVFFEIDAREKQPVDIGQILNM
ncbi:LemA family [Desulfosarcina cetonica]|uniref:LemA family protein n=1 Tax=Desulfosarcina cetonica TaxID=90730 RepID=UPI0006D089A7|nr:LemA family protein [Desulfosarcina cetonica]VTR69261.1 LemA family [Desulfosarcina cetonica]